MLPFRSLNPRDNGMIYCYDFANFSIVAPHKSSMVIPWRDNCIVNNGAAALAESRDNNP